MASDLSDSDATTGSVDLLAPEEESSSGNKRDAPTPPENHQSPRATGSAAKKHKQDEDAGVENSVARADTDPQASSAIPDAVIPEFLPTPSSAKWVVRRDCLLVRKDKNTNTDPSPRTKAAAFDMDGTLLLWRCAGWPSRPEHYELWSTGVISKLQHLYDNEGYQLVVFSNQGGIKKAFGGKTAAKVKGLIDWLAKTLDRPLLAVVSTSTKSGYHKPACKMWEICEQECNGGVEFQPSQSIYVGDSDGSNSEGNDAYQDLGVDKEFAKNVGKERDESLAFYTPQVFFGESDSVRRKEARLLFGGEYDAPPQDALKSRAALLGGYLEGPILLILCGAQGSGKSTFCFDLLDKSRWVHLSQDTINNGKPGKREMVEKAAFDALTQEKLSVVVDRMHLDPDQRSHFIQVAQKAKVPAHALLLNPPKQELEKRVRERTDHPGGVQGDRGVRLAVASLDKLVMPTYQEGLDLITLVSSADAATVICDMYHRVCPSKEPPGNDKKSILPPTFRLTQHNGPNRTDLPSIALGTQKVGKRVASEVVSSALSKGLLAVDTAPTYYNEKEVGTGLAEHDECFAIVKIPKRVTRPSQAREEFLCSLDKLGRSKVDLALIHWPCDFIEAETLKAVWEELEQLVSEGHVRALGVCNFSIDALRLLLPICKSVRPAVNQIERHPLLPQWELLDFCMNNGIVVQAHTALGQGREELLQHPTVAKIVVESAGGLSCAQVVLRWNLQQGVAVVTRCSSESHIDDTLRLLGDGVKCLGPAEMKELDAIANVEAAQIRFVAPPFMYKSGAPYSWGDSPPNRN